MAIERVVRCDLCGQLVTLKERARVAFRRDVDRPDTPEYVDVGPECHHRPIGEVIEFALQQLAKVESNGDET